MDPPRLSTSPHRMHSRPLPGTSGPPGTVPPSALSPLGDLPPIPEGEPLLPRRHVQFHAESLPSPPAPGLAPALAPSSSSGSSSSDDDETYVAEARPPDGGWGWVVVFASFMVNLIADGITFSFGVFYPHFLEYFGESKGKTALIAGIFMAMPLLSGPIASFLTDRYGCRRVTIFGATLASAGFAISAFVNDIETLFFTFGIMAGFGLSLCYVAAVVIVAYYFERKRSLATGVSVCGSGIGTFVFAPLSYVLLDEYGWRGTTLILSGLFLNMAACGLLFRDLPWTTTMNEEKARERKLRREKKRRRRFGSTVEGVAGAVRVESAESGVARFSSLVDLPTYLSGGELSAEALDTLSGRGRVPAALLQSPGTVPISRSFSDGGRLAVSGGGGGEVASVGVCTGVGVERGTGVVLPRARPASFLRDLRLHRHSLTYRGAMLNISRYRLRASSCPNIFRNSMTTIAKEKEVWYAGLWDFWDLVVDLLDFSHFLNPAFLVFAISNFLLYMWYDVPYVYIADNGLAMGFNESQTSVLISIIGILNMFGEILLGWVGDWECVNPSLVYAGSMVLCGAVTFVMPLLHSYSGMAVAVGGFGAFIAANYSLTSIILVEQITLEKFTNAYGLLLLIQGVANLIGPPLAGWVFDITGSYDLSFYMAGVFIALSGLILVVLPIYKCMTKRNNNKPIQTNATIENGHVKQNGKAIC